MVYLRISQQHLEFFKKIEGETLYRIAESIDSAKCLPFQEVMTFIASLSLNRQDEFAQLVSFESLVLEVQHKNEMKVSKPDSRFLTKANRLRN